MWPTPPGAVDWQPHIPRLFTHIIGVLEVPVGNASGCSPITGSPTPTRMVRAFMPLVRRGAEGVGGAGAAASAQALHCRPICMFCTPFGPFGPAFSNPDGLQLQAGCQRLINAGHASACSNLPNPYPTTLLEPVRTNPPDPQFLAGEASIAARTIVHLLKSTAERPCTEASSADALANVQHLVCLLEQYYHPSNTGERYRRGFIKR